MGLIKAEAPEVLNFVLTGQTGGGASILRDAVAVHPTVVCHGNLLDHDDSVRRLRHEDYFGPSGTTPDWLVNGHISGEQYITNKIFDNPLHGEKVVGLTVAYSHMYAYDLWDYFESWCCRGDFCLIQVKRNPVACFVSLQDHDPRNLLETRPDGSREGKSESIKSPLQINIDDLVWFVRQHIAADDKIARICDDRLEIEYSEIILDYAAVMREVLSFLGLPEMFVRPPASLGEHRECSNRMSKWSHLQDKVPPDIRKYFDRGEIF
jgi:hypothetical protein